MDVRVRPPLFDTELVDIFMGTLQGMYFQKMVGSISSNFSDVIIIDEHIENELKTRKIYGGANHQIVAKKPQSNFTRKKEGETSDVMANFHPKFQASIAPVPQYPYPYVVAVQYQ